MAKFSVDIREDRDPELYLILMWLKKARISHAEAADNALYSRYFIDALLDDEAPPAELLRAIDNVRSQLNERLNRLNLIESRLLGATVPSQGSQPLTKTATQPKQATVAEPMPTSQPSELEEDENLVLQDDPMG